MKIAGMPVVIAVALFAAPCQPAFSEEHPALSPENKEMAYSNAEGLAACAGAYEAAAISIKAPSRTNASANVHAIANGAAMAGSWLLYSLGIIKDWKSAQSFVEEKADTERVRWLALIEGVASDKELDDVGNSLRDKIDGCNTRYGELQAMLVKQMRRTVYESAPAKN